MKRLDPYQYKPFWISIVPIRHCTFSRRNGIKGRVIFGHSVCLRLFGYEII